MPLPLPLLPLPLFFFPEADGTSTVLLGAADRAAFVLTEGVVVTTGRVSWTVDRLELLLAGPVVTTATEVAVGWDAAARLAAGDVCGAATRLVAGDGVVRGVMTAGARTGENVDGRVARMRMVLEAVAGLIVGSMGSRLVTWW